jgi:hypothetical protein
MYKIILEYDDGRPVVVEREVRVLADAAVFAIDLADRAGQFRGDGHGPPKWVKIYAEGRLEIAISVIPDGLAISAEVPQRRAN